MKKIVSLLLLIIMAFGISVYSYADEADTLLIAPASTNNTIRVQQNGEYIDFKDDAGNVVNPQIINNRTMVPFRKIFNALGVADNDIMWDGETKTVVAKKNDLVIELQIDNVVAKKTLSGETTEMNLDAAPVIIDGRTLVPVRFIAESMDKKVGWDAENRVVIIIDAKEMAEDLMNSIPKYIELMNEESQMSKTYAMKSSIKGKIEYTSKENKEDNSTLNVTGTANTNVQEDAAAIDISLKFTGKGELYNALKESKFTTLGFQLIVSDNKVYIKSPIFDAQAKGKWLVYEDESMKEAFQMRNSDSISFEKVFDVDENLMNTETYQSLKTVSNVVKELLKDENIQITEKGKTKTYVVTLNLSDMKTLLKNMDADEEVLNQYDGNMKVTTTLKDGKLQTSGGEIKFGYTEGLENMKVELKLDGRIEKAATISIPSESQTVSAETIE